jgi:putative nucleotidyltransferase with HDIG domain
MGAPKLTAENILSRLDELPALPTIVYELSKVVNDPMSSTAEVEKLMSSDQGLTSKVLRMVNSAYYAIPGGVTSLPRAIAYLGFDTINQLVLSASVIRALDTRGFPDFDTVEFWTHALGVAVAAETTAKFVRHPLPSDLFTCGLLHDMGKVAQLTLEPDLIVSVVRHCKRNNCSYIEAENHMDCVRHTTIGQLLAAKWNLPAVIQHAIKYHHTQDRAHRMGATAEANRNVDIVLLSNILVHALKFGHSGHDKILGAPKDVLERLTIHPEQGLKVLLQTIKTNLEHTKEFLSFMRGNA